MARDVLIPRILHHTLNFPPDGNSTADLQSELALELRSIGHEITALTTTPNANYDAEARAKQPLQPMWRGVLYRSSFQGIPVVHVSIPQKGGRVGARVFDYARFATLSVAALPLLGEYDVVLAVSPPLTIGLSAWTLALARRTSFIYVVQEIYPDIAVRLGVLRNAGVVGAMERLERWVYARASRVVTISEWFRRRLLEKGVPPEKLRVIPNFVDTQAIRPMNRQNAFSATHGLDDKFVVLYAGNIGLTQGLDTILAAAAMLRHLPSIHVLLVGGGTRHDWLSSEIASGRHPNVSTLPYQPRSRVPEMYAASDVGIVPLAAGAAQDTFPSKIYTIMAAGRAVLVCADRDSEGPWVVERAGCGFWSPPDDARALAMTIERAYARALELPHMGARGRAYVEEHHSRQQIARRYSQLLREVVGS